MVLIIILRWIWQPLPIWYQDSAVALPEAPTKAQRAPKPFINHMDIHRWRDAWRKAKGNKATLWGNE